jgi:hypothetical protein
MGRKEKQASGGNWAAGEVGLKREEERVGDLGFCFLNPFQNLFKLQILFKV